MKTKKKVIISLSIAIAVLLIVVIAIVAVNAASNQNITSKIKVNYKPSQHVIGYVSSTYTFGDTTRVMTTNGERENVDNSKIWFAYAEKPTTKSLQMQSRDLSNGRLVFGDDIREIVFAFTFKNTGYSDFTAYLDITGITTKENFSLSYSLNNNVFISELPEILVEAPGVLTKSEKTCYIKLTIEDAAFDADFEGTFVWDLISEED